MFQWFYNWKCKKYGCRFNSILAIMFEMEQRSGMAEHMDSNLKCMCCGKVWRKDDFLKEPRTRT